MRRPLILFVLACLLAGCGASTASRAPATGGHTSPGATAAASAGPVPAATAFIAALAGGDDAAAQGMENATMLAAAPAAALGRIWQQLVGQYGPYGGTGTATLAAVPPYTNVTVRVEFAHAAVALGVTVDTAGKVAGLHVLGVTPTGGSGSPAAPSSS